MPGPTLHAQAAFCNIIGLAMTSAKLFIFLLKGLLVLNYSKFVDNNSVFLKSVTTNVFSVRFAI